jgi:gluconolactonase
VATLAAFVGFAALRAQSSAGSSIIRLDPGLDKLVNRDAKVELLKGEFFGFLEGPVWVQEEHRGYLLFSDMAANCIYKWTQDGKLSVFQEKSGFTGTDPSNAGLEINNGRLQVIVWGSNAITLDPQHRPVWCQHGDRAVVRLEQDGTRTVLAEGYEGKRFSGPNDLVIKSDGAVYFTDNIAGLRGGDKNPLREMPFHGLYLIQNGKVTLLAKDPHGAAPNGIAFSPDERILYVNGGKKISAFDVLSDDTIGNERILIDMSSESAQGNTDGMKVDKSGNVYCVGPGGIWIVSPRGVHLGTIRVPEASSNLAFGGTDGRSLYIVAHRGLYRLQMMVAGIHP